MWGGSLHPLEVHRRLLELLEAHRGEFIIVIFIINIFIIVSMIILIIILLFRNLAANIILALLAELRKGCSDSRWAQSYLSRVLLCAPAHIKRNQT